MRRLPPVRPLRSLRRLQARLTLSYMLVTVAATLLLVAAGIFASCYLVFHSTIFPRMLQEELTALGPALARRMASWPGSRAEVLEWVQEECERSEKQPDDTSPFQVSLEASPRQHLVVYITDPEGKVVTSYAPAFDLGVVPDTSLPQHLRRKKLLREARMLEAALAGEKRSEKLALRDAGKNSIAIAPAYDSNGELRAVAYCQLITPFAPGEFLSNIVACLFPVALVATLVSAAAGSVFGYLTSRRLTQRLRQMTEAADAWSRGELEVAVPAGREGGDELDDLARHLNEMAGGLRALMALRQGLATLEERNRLARDLHDTVKQQVFAVTMQVGAARSLMGRDLDAARERLREAEELAYQAQQELTCVLEELRPVHQPGKTLEAHLKTYTAAWARRSGIQAAFDADSGEYHLSPATEQALLRIAQEALSNVARHSQATEVYVRLSSTDGQVTLTIRDNGRGFSVEERRKQGGMGLWIMQERAEALPEGSFTLVSSPGEGTRLTVRCCG